MDEKPESRQAAGIRRLAACYGADWVRECIAGLPEAQREPTELLLKEVEADLGVEQRPPEEGKERAGWNAEEYFKRGLVHLVARHGAGALELHMCAPPDPATSKEVVDELFAKLEAAVGRQGAKPPRRGEG